MVEQLAGSRDCKSRSLIGHGSSNLPHPTFLSLEYLMPWTYNYQMPMCIADCVIINPATEILLIQRKNDPGMGMWALPGGFINPYEEPIEAARRELEEETGLRNIPLKLFDVINGEDPRGWMIKIIYYADLSENVVVTPGDDAKDYRWLHIQECSYATARKFLFTDHQQIISDLFLSKYFTNRLK